MRDTVESIIKDLHLNRSRIFEVSPFRYRSIIQTVQQHFIKHSGDLHWANITNRFCPSLAQHSLPVDSCPLWFRQLDKIISDIPCYVLFEDSLRMQPKYWVYEMHPTELIAVLNESSPQDFYIVSKKFDWLITECHEDIVFVVGNADTVERIFKKLNHLLQSS